VVCPQESLYGFRALRKAWGWKLPFDTCSPPPTTVAPPPRSFPPAGWTPSDLIWQFQPGEVFAWPGSLLPGVSVYVLDMFNTSQAVVTSLTGAGYTPVCHIRWVTRVCLGLWQV
jgi:hypothetical protein